MKDISFELHKEDCIKYLQVRNKYIEEQLINQKEQDKKIQEQHDKIIALTAEVKCLKTRQPITNIQNNNYYDSKNIANIARDHLTPVDYEDIVYDYTKSIFNNGSDATKKYIIQKITINNVICLDLDRKIFATVDKYEYFKTKLFIPIMDLLQELSIPAQRYMTELENNAQYINMRSLYRSQGESTIQEQLIYNLTILKHKEKYAHSIIDEISDSTNFTKAVNSFMKRNSICL